MLSVLNPEKELCCALLFHFNFKKGWGEERKDSGQALIFVCACNSFCVSNLWLL